MPPSARELHDDEWELVELTRATIDATIDAGPDEDGAHTMGAAARAADSRTFVGVNLSHFTGGPAPNWSPSARRAPAAQRPSPRSLQ